MKRTTAFLLLGAALCCVSPANAEEPRAQTLSVGSNASSRQHEMSSRHRHLRHGRSVVMARACDGFTVAPTLHKVYGDRRWPYVSWFGSCDSLYAPGPAVTFVRYSW
jgi:hypothetical protein